MLFSGQSTSATTEALHRSLAVIEFKPDGTILTANANFLDTVGYTLAEVQGRHHSLFVDPVERDKSNYRDFWAALARGEFQRAGFKRFGKDGREIWLQATYNPILDRKGRVTRVIKFASDITEQKLRSAANEAKVAAIHRSQAVIEFALDGTILDANQNFLQAVGYDLAGIKGRHHRLFVDPAEHDSASYQEFWASLARGEFRSGEYKRRAEGGREIWLQATYNPVFDPTGKAIGVVKFASDITADKLRTLDHTAQIAAIDRSQGVVHFALDGTILEANEKFLAAVGYRLEEIRGQHHRMFVEPSYAASAEYQGFWEHLRSGQFHASNYQRLGKGGRQISIQATYNPVVDANGRPTRVVKYCTDITASVASWTRAIAASGEAAASVQASAAAAEELSASVAEIAHSAARSKTLIDTINAQAEAGGRSTGDLEQAAASMNGIVQVIRTVGEQINLLALNATIEAARAGEAGRGFTVVAGEVKNLAQQVTKATGQIAQDIQRMQGVAEAVVTSLRTIEHSVTEAQAVVNGIASAVEEQSAVTQEISSAMQGASRGLEQVNLSLSAIS